MGGIGRTPYFIGVTDFVSMRHSVEVLENCRFVADALWPHSPPESSHLLILCGVVISRGFARSDLLCQSVRPFHAPSHFAFANGINPLKPVNTTSSLAHVAYPTSLAQRRQ
jgi:hypothetical protein